MSIREKLQAMGLEIPVAPLPVAAYVPAVRTGNLVFTAGQLPLVHGKIPYVGKVDGGVTPEQAKEMAQVCALNCLGALETVASVEDVVRIVRVCGYVNGVPGFIAAPAVVNGASELFISLWGDTNGKHARSAFGVAELPLDAPVEIELIAEVK
jgi:enamine deaminase RidA (YjgF/YER057c/UK114 family)